MPISLWIFQSTKNKLEREFEFKDDGDDDKPIPEGVDIIEIRHPEDYLRKGTRGITNGLSEDELTVFGCSQRRVSPPDPALFNRTRSTPIWQL